MIFNQFSLLSFLLFSTASIAQTNLYVALAGSDNTGNGSIGSPHDNCKSGSDCQ